MNRFLRTAFAASFAYFFLSLIPAIATGVGMPLPAFVCLYFGLLLILLPYCIPKLSKEAALFVTAGILLELLGFLPIRLYNCPNFHYIVHGIGAAFAAAFIGVMRHRTTHDDFSAKFRFSVVLIIGIISALVISMLFHVTEDLIVPIGRSNVWIAIEHGVPIAIMLLVTGVLLLRGLRGLQGTMNERDFNRRQLRDVLIYASLVSAVFLVNPYLYRVLRWIMVGVLRPAFRKLGVAFDEFLELIANKDPNFYDIPEAEETPLPTEYAAPPQTDMFVDKEPEHYMIDDADEGSLYRTLLYIFAAVAAAVLLTILVIELVKLIKKLRERGGGRGRGYPNEITESLGEDDTGVRAAKPKKRGEPRIRIRYYYREFLRLLRRAHVLLEPSDTCGNINDRAQTTIRKKDEELSEFRELYEKARYSAEEAPTEQDAARMKALYDDFKNKR